MWDPLRWKWGDDFHLVPETRSEEVHFYSSIRGMNNPRSKLAAEKRKDVEDIAKEIKRRFGDGIIDYGWANGQSVYHQSCKAGKVEPVRKSG